MGTVKFVLELRGSYLISVWKLFDICVGAAWELCDIYVGTVKSVLELRGSYMTSACVPRLVHRFRM